MFAKAVILGLWIEAKEWWERRQIALPQPDPVDFGLLRNNRSGDRCAEKPLMLPKLGPDLLD